MKDEQKTRKQLIEELTELRRRTTELEVSESRVRQDRDEMIDFFRNSTPIGLFIIQDGKFEFVNENFRAVTGNNPDDLLGTDPMRLVLPEDREVLRENAIAMLKGERTAPYRYRIMTKDGDTRWMLEGVASVQYRGNRAAVGQSLDITELERTQEKLEELYAEEKTLRKELEAQIERRIEFTRALVHELKTPLTPVLSSSELLVSELHEEPWTSVAANIHRGAANLSKRIDELLDLARVEIGRLQVNRIRVDVLQLFQEIADEMTTVVLDNGQSLQVKLPPSLPSIWADEERLRQVVLNLLINASKFTPEGGKITLSAGEKDAALVVEVKDTGQGIPEEEQQRLFQPYYRLVSDREHLSGLGLGLALSKYLVELHGGEIWVKSKEGKGSTFGFSIPLIEDEQQREDTEQEAPDEGSAD